MRNSGYIDKEILWIDFFGWIMLIGICIIGVILYFRYYKPIKKIKAEAVNTFSCFGEWRFIFIFIWTGIMICFYLYQIFINPDMMVFTAFTFLGIFPMLFAEPGIIYINDYELFINGTVVKISSLDKIEYSVEHSSRGGFFYIVKLKVGEKVINKFITRRSLEFLRNHINLNLPKDTYK